jgi:hypothetical protein
MAWFVDVEFLPEDGGGHGYLLPSGEVARGLGEDRVWFAGRKAAEKAAARLRAEGWNARAVSPRY